jgi:hypothetical protein
MAGFRDLTHDVYICNFTKCEADSPKASGSLP